MNASALVVLRESEARRIQQPQPENSASRLRISTAIVIAIAMKREDRRHREIVDAIERHGPPPGWSR